MTSTKGRRWTLLACNSPLSPPCVDPVVNPKIPSVVLFSLLLRLRYLFQRMEFAAPVAYWDTHLLSFVSFTITPHLIKV